MTDSPTVETLFILYMELHARPFTKSWRNTAEYWYRHIEERWGKERAASLSRLDVQRWVIELAEHSGKPTATRTFTVLAAVLNWAERNDYISKNPCRGVRTFKPEYRERFLQPHELGLLFGALERLNTDMKDVFLLCLSTGARKSNVLSMRWQDVNIEQALWRLPGAITKNSQPHSIPLSPKAIAILAERRRYIDSPFVFPGRGKSGHLRWPKNAWRKVTREAGLDDVRIHDLRRTVGSYMAISGASPYIIGAALGHKDPRSTAIYARLNVQPIRDAFEQVERQWETICTEHPAPRPQCAIVPQQTSRLTEADRVRAEGRILLLLNGGITTKGGYQRRIGFRLSPSELDEVLDSLVQRGLIERFKGGPGGRAHWQYRLRHELRSSRRTRRKPY